MFKRLIAGALFAGLSAGALAALIHLSFVVPLIHAGELYESGALVHFGAPADQSNPETPAGRVSGLVVAAEGDHDHAGHDHGDAEQGPWARSLGTVGFFLVSYTGFALLLIVGFAIAERSGHAITARTGVIWGVCGFLAVQLAPAFGLPPELPGGQGAALELRQVWWAGCVLASLAGLGLLAFGSTAMPLVAGAALIALPHLIGAPGAAFGGVAPPELAAHFATRALGAGAVCWAVLGCIAGTVWARSAAPPLA